MKTYEVCLISEFLKTVKVRAHSEDEAVDLATERRGRWSGPTEVEVWYVVEAGPAAVPVEEDAR